MSPIAFLLVALVISLLGSMVLWLRARKPTSLRSSIDTFKREMDALSPQDQAKER
ncbi:MAG: hypothetical protein QOC92_3139 [Acidimicrobiaceae bacterium]